MADCSHSHLQTWGRFRPRQLQTNCSWGALVQAICKYSQPLADSVHRTAAASHTHTQAGYQSHLSTVHQTFVLQHVIDKQKHAHEPLYLCFVDLKAAYDKVQWPLIWQVLQRLGIHGSMLTAIQSLYTDCSLAMKVNGFLGDMHSPSVGLCQALKDAHSVLLCLVFF